MKHLKPFLFIAIITLFSHTQLSAQEALLNVDFSSNEWTTAFEDAGLILVDDIVSIGSEFSTHAFNPGIYGGIEGVQGFYINGHWSAKWVAEPGTGVDGRTITHSVRLRSNSESYIQLPKLSSAGKVAVFVMNSNGSTSTNFNIQKLEDDTTWTNLTTLTTVGSNNYPDGAFEDKLEFEVNSSTPITLRVHKNSARFMNVFKITVDEYEATGIKNNFSAQASIHMQGKTMHIQSEQEALSSIQLIDLSGRLVWNTQTAEKQVQLPASIQQGLYIVRMANEHGSLNQSVVVH